MYDPFMYFFVVLAREKSRAKRAPKAFVLPRKEARTTVDVFLVKGDSRKLFQAMLTLGRDSLLVVQRGLGNDGRRVFLGQSLGDGLENRPRIAILL